jgi:hypothetical protein
MCEEEEDIFKKSQHDDNISSVKEVGIDRSEKQDE